MNPTRRRRLWFVLALLAAAAVAATLVAFALQRNIAYLYTPNEVFSGSAGAAVSSGEARFRLGGMVEEDSFRREEGSLVARFRVTDGDAQMEVVYDKILPDLFREGQGVVAEGSLGPDGTFMATNVLAKHDENYIPKEVVEALKASGEWRPEGGE